MINPLDNVPLNLTSIYVRGITLDGCEVYMPVNVGFEHKEYIQQKKRELQFYLDNQYEVEPEAA